MPCSGGRLRERYPRLVHVLWRCAAPEIQPLPARYEDQGRTPKLSANRWGLQQRGSPSVSGQHLPAPAQSELDWLAQGLSRWNCPRHNPSPPLTDANENIPVKKTTARSIVIPPQFRSG